MDPYVFVMELQGFPASFAVINSFDASLRERSCAHCLVWENCVTPYLIAS